jgi:chromosomal replication initiator protein
MAKSRKENEAFNTADLQIDSQFNEKYNFDNFIIGDCNQSARSAGFFVSCKQGEKLFNPLFVYGESGLGKTHLAHAIGNETKKRFPEKNVFCVTSDDFCRQYIDSVENKCEDDFVGWLELVDILILEDIQLLTGQSDVQEGS